MGSKSVLGITKKKDESRALGGGGGGGGVELPPLEPLRSAYGLDGMMI